HRPRPRAVRRPGTRAAMPRRSRRSTRPRRARNASSSPAPISTWATSKPPAACCRKWRLPATRTRAARPSGCCATWPEVPRYAIGVEYDGAGFSGWQRLTRPGAHDDATVQGVLETALSSVADADVATVCAGRTDAGVHAQCQVAHFDSGAVRDPRAWTLGATTRLPPSVSVTWCRPVADDFSARFSAVA